MRVWAFFCSFLTASCAGPLLYSSLVSLSFAPLLDIGFGLPYYVTLARGRGGGFPLPCVRMVGDLTSLGRVSPPPTMHVHGRWPTFYKVFPFPIFPLKLFIVGDF